MKCTYCNEEVEIDDNFCWKCGHWTIKGYKLIKHEENSKKILNGEAVKKDRKFLLLIYLLITSISLFTLIISIQDSNLFKPFILLQQKLNNYIYNYDNSIIKTDNKYRKMNISTYEDAIKIIEKDFEKQSWLCINENNITKEEYELEKKLKISSVVFCEISINHVNKIRNTIIKIYDLFPNIDGALTNITITNTKSDYIAYFQPLYQFVNIGEDINEFNKVNKTQILLNSYYFLNEEILNKPIEQIVGYDWYVEDATWDSVIAHEFGHYISFVILLKENKINSITFENIHNEKKIEQIIDNFNKGIFSNQIVIEALNNYNLKNNCNLDIDTFALSISRYAASKDKNDNLIFDEIIAEAVHDYYLHGNNMKNSSKEIINIIKNRLGNL